MEDKDAKNVRRSHSGTYALIPVYSASLLQNEKIPSCPKCNTHRFVASFIDRERKEIRGVCCENGHGFDPINLTSISLSTALRSSGKYALKTTNEAIDIWANDYIDEIKQSGDRAAAIISSSMLEELLKFLIHSFSINEDIAKKLTGINQPLGTFSSKIDFCYSFGLISKTEWESLYQIRQIRNDFAHKLSKKTFTDTSINDRVSNLAKMLEISIKENTKRQIFEKSIEKLWDSFFKKLSLVKRCANMPFNPSDLIERAWFIQN